MPRKLRIILIQKGMKQGELAGLTGISPSTLSQIINSRINPTLDEVKTIRDALKYRGKDLFEEMS